MIQSICLLGSFRVCSDSVVSIPKKGKAVLALLAMAALDGDGMSRDRLSTMLWPHLDYDNARHALRNCLTELRQAMRAEAVKTLITDFVDCRADVSTDVGDFVRLEKSNNQHDLEMAAELYRGEVLDDLWINSEPFREWIDIERELWRQRAVAVLIRLSITATVNADHDAAIKAGRRVVHIDPWNEAGHRQLMIALEAGGKRSQAIRQFRICRKTLKKELGIDPDPETRDLADRLFAGKQVPTEAGQTIWAVERAGIEPQDEVLLRRATTMLDEAREELRADREVMAKVLLQLDGIIGERRVRMAVLEAMRERIKRRLSDEYWRSRAQSNGEVGVPLGV